MRIRNYQQQVQEVDANNFRDRPDPINTVRLVQSFDDSVVIEWEKPCDNNEEIVLYNIQVSERRETNEMDILHQTEAKPEEQFATYRIPDLEPDTVYYVRVVAVNAIGEGYSPEKVHFVRTMKDSINEPGSLYVWGNNQSSELGLSDEAVQEHKNIYYNYAIRGVVR